MSNNKTLARFGAAITGTMMLCAASAANAGLVGVKDIVITSANPNLGDNWLQISEVVAIKTGGGDVALTGTATASSKTPPGFGTSLNLAIDGIGPTSHPNAFHSGTQDDDEWYKVTFNDVTELDSIEIMGRIGCCNTRDIYNVAFLDDDGDTLFSLTDLFALPAQNDTTGTITLPDTSTPPTNEISEPGTLALFGLGLAGLGFARRRKTAK